jgi:hypothetical protein
VSGSFLLIAIGAILSFLFVFCFCILVLRRLSVMIFGFSVFSVVEGVCAVSFLFLRVVLWNLLVFYRCLLFVKNHLNRSERVDLLFLFLNVSWKFWSFSSSFKSIFMYFGFAWDSSVSFVFFFFGSLRVIWSGST